MQLREQANALSLLRCNNAKEHQNSSFVPYNNRISNEINNYGNTYSYYSPYALRRRDYYRSYSPASTKIPQESNLTNIQRSYSPYRQALENSKEYEIKNKTDDRPHSPYCNNFTNIESRSYSPYSWRLDEKDRDLGERINYYSNSRSSSPFTRDYSPWRRENVDPPGVIPIPVTTRHTSSYLQQRLGQIPTVSQKNPQEVNSYGSPLLTRKRFPSEPPVQGSHNTSTSPQLILSRFSHQLNQEAPVNPPVQLSSKESAKRRFASYIRLRLGSDRNASPEPPPRLNRGESPLLFRKNFGEQASPLFPRRYVSPSPPMPPPRRLSESSSVPGSPQLNLLSRLHYTPELQRRVPNRP